MKSTDKSRVCSVLSLQDPNNAVSRYGKVSKSPFINCRSTILSEEFVALAELTGVEEFM